MKKLIMICITAAVMMAPLAAYARPGRVFVGRVSGGGTPRTGGPIRIQTAITVTLLRLAQ